MCRNNVANLREYVGVHGVLASWSRRSGSTPLTRPDPGRLRMSLGAMWAGLARRLPRPPEVPRGGRPAADADGRTVAVVVVTYNRADLLAPDAGRACAPWTGSPTP